MSRSIAPAVKSLNAATATGNGSSVPVPQNRVDSNVGVFLTTTGSPTNVVVNVDALAPDGTWCAVASATVTVTTGAGSAVVAVPGSAREIRARLTTLTGGTTPSVTVWFGFITTS